MYHESDKNVQPNTVSFLLYKDQIGHASYVNDGRQGSHSRQCRYIHVRPETGNRYIMQPCSK